MVTKIANCLKKQCTVKNLKRRLPILGWLPKYSFDTLFLDAVAGISVGLAAVPQCIAYAGIAGLELQYGLYSGFMGCFVYLIFGSCKDLTIGPTAILSLMTQQYGLKYGADFVILLTFLSGCLVLLLGLLNLGFLIQFISTPVTTGFTSAAALTICATQLHYLLGYNGMPATFLKSITNFIEEYSTIKLWDSVMGISTIIFLLLTKEVGKYGKRTSTKDTPWHKSLFEKLSWILSLGRNALVIIIGCLIAWIFSKYDLTPFTLTGTITGGLPPFRLPPFSTVYNNETLDFFDMASILGPSILTISLISILEAVAIAKAFSTGTLLDFTQEFCALGLSNVFGSFVGSMPTTSAFSRCVINNASGVQTTAGGILTGALVLMSLSFLTETFQYIPQSVLAGLIISAVIHMVEIKVVVLYWKTRKIELIPYMGTVLACLFLGLQVGIFAGVCLNVILMLLTAAKPKIDLEMTKMNGYDVLVVVPDDDLLFCSADYFSKKVMKIAFNKKNINNTTFMIVIDGCKINRLDITVAKNIKALIEGMKMRNQKIFLWRFDSKLEDVLKGVHPDVAQKFASEKNVEDIIKYCTREELTSLVTK